MVRIDQTLSYKFKIQMGIPQDILVYINSLSKLILIAYANDTALIFCGNNKLLWTIYKNFVEAVNRYGLLALGGLYNK